MSLDHLSNGRLILSVGLGEPGDTEFGQFGEETDVKVRATKLDEGLDVLAGLWRGKSFSYQGNEPGTENGFLAAAGADPPLPPPNRGGRGGLAYYIEASISPYSAAGIQLVKGAQGGERRWLCRASCSLPKPGRPGGWKLYTSSAIHWKDHKRLFAL